MGSYCIYFKIIRDLGGLGEGLNFFFAIFFGDYYGVSHRRDVIFCGGGVVWSVFCFGRVMCLCCV